jgi:hypothetical protein
MGTCNTKPAEKPTTVSSPIKNSPYRKCTAINQIPPIDLTPEIIQIVITNACSNIEYIESIKYLLCNYNSSMNASHILCLIKFNNTEIINLLLTTNRVNGCSIDQRVEIILACIKLNNNEINDNLIKYIIKPNITDHSTYCATYKTVLICESITAKNSVILQWLIKNISYCKHGPSYSIHYGILPLTLTQIDENRNIDIDMTKILIQLASNKYENEFKDFARKHKDSYSDNGVIDNFKIIQAILNCGEDLLIWSIVYFENMYKKNQHNILNDIYISLCNMKYEKICIELIKKQYCDNSDILYHACKNNLKTLCDMIYSKKLLTRDHLYTKLGDCIDLMIYNDIFELFQKIIKRYFINTGKINPETKNSNFGKYLIKACNTCSQVNPLGNGNRDKYVEVLLDNIVFSDDLLVDMHYSASILSIKELIKAKIQNKEKIILKLPSVVHVLVPGQGSSPAKQNNNPYAKSNSISVSTIEPSRVGNNEVSQSSCYFKEDVPVFSNQQDSDNYCELSNVIVRIKEQIE